jgi:hypothetical protein
MESFVPDCDLTKYIDDLEKESTYADHVAIQTMCTMLSCRVTIVHSTGAPDIILGNPSSTEVLLGYLPDIKHYVSLEPTMR